LIDAAPLIAAQELGYFAEEGLHVVLQRQIGWGNIRDKLTFGELHASHALLGMAPLSVLGREQFAEPLVAIASLGAGGNAITLSRRLTTMGVTSAESLARFIRRREGAPLLFAHVFRCSMHHYLLRDWLAGAKIEPDVDVRFCVLPPSQMTRQLAEGLLDGFCVGEPWNSLAEHDGRGTIVTSTARILPDHPEKVLAVGKRWLASHRDKAERLVRATLRGCAYCHDPANVNELARFLAGDEYLGLPIEVVLKTLTALPADFRSWAPVTTFPSATHAAWLLEQMYRWKHLSVEIDPAAVARASVDLGPYRAAAASLGWACPQDELGPMRVRGGWFSPSLKRSGARDSPVGALG
jgi:ABC-type nitrate/sulfonate/bicarbonate transport system substrate-binding protein